MKITISPHEKLMVSEMKLSEMRLYRDQASYRHVNILTCLVMGYFDKNRVVFFVDSCVGAI